MIKHHWMIELEDLTRKVSEIYGLDVSASVFARYDVTSFEDLNPCYYNEVLGDLMQMYTD